MLTITAPGQGAQAPGFLSAWLELPGWADRLGAWSELAGCDLIRAGTTAGADEIRDTAVAQPLLVAAAVSTAEELFGGLSAAPEGAGAVAGHSVGELAAGKVTKVMPWTSPARLTTLFSALDAMSVAGYDAASRAVPPSDPQREAHWP